MCIEVCDLNEVNEIVDVLLQNVVSEMFFVEICEDYVYVYKIFVSSMSGMDLILEQSFFEVFVQIFVEFKFLICLQKV